MSENKKKVERNMNASSDSTPIDIKKELSDLEENLNTKIKELSESALAKFKEFQENMLRAVAKVNEIPEQSIYEID